MALSTAQVNVLCNGNNTGSIDLSVTGGTAPYSYLWSNNSTIQDPLTLIAGTYSVTVTDASGCTATTSATIIEPTALILVTTSTPVTCSGAGNGTGNVLASGGTPAYNYLWSNGATTINATALNPGTYTILVTDGNGCQNSASVIITEPSPLIVSAVVSSPILCNGGNATLTITATGGTAPYTGIGTFTVTSGSYTYNVTDFNGCISNANINVTQPGVLVTNITQTSPILCFGGLGQVSVSGSGGTAPYFSTGSFNVSAGTTTFSITDVNGCPSSNSILVIQPTQLAVNVTGVNPLCNAGNTGSAIATVSGGTAPYSYSWSNGGNTSNNLNLIAGNYSVTVTDLNGCSVIGSITLTQPNTLGSSSVVSSPIVCNGGTGQVTVSGVGGTAPYSGTGTFTVLAGTSNFTVTDANGCVSTTNINVPEPSLLVASSSVSSPINCFNGTGTILVSATGGTPSYSNTGSFVVNAGSYNYIVTDANGCTANTTAIITQPSQLTPTATIINPIPCNGGTATISISATGGTPTYTGTGNFTANAGIQNYTVLDLNNCSATVSINVVQPSLLTSSVSVQNVSCNGLNNGSATVSALGGTPNYTYLWSNGNTIASVSNLAPGTYTVLVTDANGCVSNNSATITQPTGLSSSATQTSNIACFGGTGNVFVSATGGTTPFTGVGNFAVPAGNQSFTITDANGCVSTSTLTLIQPTQLFANATQTSPILCFGGQASVAVTGIGGTGAYTGTGSFNVFAGNNTFTIQDANNCPASTSINITQPTAVSATFTNSNVTCFGFTNGSSTVVLTGGTPGYNLLWNTGSTTNNISSQAAGTYTLTVTDANNCPFIFNTTITQPSAVVATANIILPIACFGGQATVLVNGAGGTPGYSGNGTFLEFAGTYTYTLTDINGCSGSTTLTVTQPNAFLASAVITTPIACNGGQATVVVSAIGGVAPYTGTGTFTVSPGTYTYTLIDANGCVAITTITVTQPAILVASANISQTILCNGNNATVIVTASGGTIPYSGTGTFTVPAGNYTYLVSDANGCNSSVSISVTQPTLLISSVIPINVSCNGANDGSATVFFSGGTPSYSVLWSTGATSNTINNLAPGNYTVAITDNNGCVSSNAFTITQPNVLLANATLSVPILCFNGQATVNVSATGGTLPYTGVGNYFPVVGTYSYIVTDANGCSDTATITISQPSQLVASVSLVTPITCFGGQATVNIVASGGVGPYTGTGNINVSAGSQTFVVIDANGCSVNLNIFITQPPILSAPITSQNISCNGLNNGTATVNAQGGTPGYQYLWSNGATTNSITGLSPGIYSVNVTDTNGCLITNQVNITQPTLLTSSSVISSPVFCFGGTATVVISAAGGTTPYSGTGSFNVTAGVQNFNVTDANGCISTVSITITQPNLLVASVVQTSNILCNNGSGIVNVSAIGGTPAYTGTGNFTIAAGWQNYTVIDSYGCTDTTSIYITQPSPVVANVIITSPILCNGGNANLTVTGSGGTPGYSGQGSFTVVAGTYNYTVTDANGCTGTTTVVVTQPAVFQAIANITSPVVCNGGTGLINISTTGGTAPFVGTGNFIVLAGTYTYNVTDASGCTASVTITLTQPPVLSITLSQINVNCNGFATGTITANPTGGQGPYTYSWSNGQTTQTISNLLAGTYSVIITDQLGCIKTASTVITQPSAAITLQETHVNVLCFGNNTGSINLTPAGGVLPYTYLWSNSATTQDINTLIAGNYSVSVTDGNGCQAVLSVTITQPNQPLTVGYIVTNVSCFGLINGSIDVTPVGGTAPYTYFWSTTQVSQDISNLAPGQYIVSITDANNCVSSTAITVTQPLAPLSVSISQAPITCYGYNDGQLTANGAGGTIPYSYVWQPGAAVGSINSLLGPGTYTVQVTDANGCVSNASATLNSPPALIASFTVSDNVVCLPASVTFTNASIGTFTSVLWNLSTGVSNNSNQFNVALNTLGCINATMTITDVNGCTADTTISNVVCVVPGPTASFTSNTPEINFETGEITFTNTSINEDQVLWEFGDNTQSTLDDPTHFYPAQTFASYDVTLIAIDVNGCIDSITQTFELNDNLKLNVPNSFTPNGDGLNDVFLPIFNAESGVKEYKFEVYNRWGQLIYETGDLTAGWDGKYKSKICQQGSYNWIIYYQDFSKNPYNVNGHVTLIK